MTVAYAPLEVDEDLEFQRREWRLQRIGWWGFGAFILCAVLGLFGGGGPLGVASRANSTLTVVYQRFVRSGTSTRLLVSVAPPASGAAELILTRAYFDAIRIERITPEPMTVAIDADEVTLRFSVGAGAGSPVVVLDLSFARPGRYLAEIRLPGGLSVAWSQIAFF
jgi:hypothetical protein